MTSRWTLVLLAIFLSVQIVVAGLPGLKTTKKLVKRGEDNKYFHEPGRDDILGHYDTRYFKKVVSYDERSATLLHMTRAYLGFFREQKLETWIAHGTLLGWWWNGKILPWDWDVDTQVNDATLRYLGENLNQTIYKYEPLDNSTTREYLLDVNPWSRQRERGDGQNIIDARWIDRSNGLYIDITGITELHPDTEPGILRCKNFHKYETGDLWPMRESTFEGVPAMIPYKYLDLLIGEYKKKAMAKKAFQDHNWSEDSKDWIPDKAAIEKKAQKYKDLKVKKH